jgi:hypothetical protein
MTRSEHDHRRLAHHAASPGYRPHHEHHQAERHHRPHRFARRQWNRLRQGALKLARQPAVQRTFWISGIVLGVVLLAFGVLWWRLSSGPIDLEAATPWLKAAIEKNFGGNQTVVVGGTQIERDENGRTRLRLRDIIVRDADGTIVASAPKAEVGISGYGLLSGQVRAESLNLVGAELAVRIEADGRVTVFAGAENKTPIAVARPALSPAPPPDASIAAGVVSAGAQNIASLLAWIDGLGATGLDGHDLRELGLKNGSLIVDDQRSGKRWNFSKIDVSLTRPEPGGVAFRLASDDPDRPWVLSTAVRPLNEGVRAVGLEARKVSVNDILLALRLQEVTLEADVPLSASVRAEIASDGALQRLQGQVVAEPGTIVDREGEGSSFKIDSADIRFTWDPRQRALAVPFQVQVEGNQFTLRAMLGAPAEHDGAWLFSMVRDDPVIDPVILPAGKGDEESVSLNRVAVRARIDPARRRIDIDQADFGRIDPRPAYNVGVAASGSFDYSGAESRLVFGVAGTRMPMAVMKRLWPSFVALPTRRWVIEHIFGGTVERVVVAGNALLPTFKTEGPPLPDDALSVDIETSGITLRPLPDLPPIRDADLTAHISGRTATVSLGRGTVEITPQRKMNIASGVFTIPDTHLKPQPARTTFRMDGTTAAAAALLATDALRNDVGITLDPASSRGTVAAQVTLNMLLGRSAPKNNSTYTVTADLSNFGADKVLMGQRIEASSLRATASSDGYQITGDVKINGTPATIDLSKKKNEADAVLRLQATLDETARRRLGIDLGSAVTGSVPIKAVAILPSDGRDPPMNVDADLTLVKVDNLLPGWVKPAGKPAHATYTLFRTATSVRIDDMLITGSGASVKGSVELDGASEIVSANFPVFSLAEGDKASIKAERGTDGVLRVQMRGDIFDGTNLVKNALAGASADRSRHKPVDLDLDIKVGTVVGHNGETLRGLDLKLTRRADHIRTFAMNSKIGRDTPLNGELRFRSSDRHQVIFVETDDAGALFRFTDMYPKMFGGQMWIAMDPPTGERAAQVGILSIRNFNVRGEPGLERAIAGAPGQVPGSVPFTELHCEFTRSTGRMVVRDGVVRGPVMGVTIEGQIDHARNEVHLRGTFVPFYGLNNMFGQIPIVGLFLGGGSNEGLFGITYEASGPPNGPRITVNPVTAITPGLLRKFIPSPGSFDQNYVPPARSEAR